MRFDLLVGDFFSKPRKINEKNQRVYIKKRSLKFRQLEILFVILLKELANICLQIQIQI